MMAPRAVDPVLFPITPPTTAPPAAPMTAPFSFRLNAAQALDASATPMRTALNVVRASMVDDIV
jgi:hypothetical protein